MPAPCDGTRQAASTLADLFRCQAALSQALSLWQAQWSFRSLQHQPLSLQEVGLAVSFQRSSDGLYSATLLHEQGASLESGSCSTPQEAYLLVLGVLNPDCLLAP
jgi:hypothetical protein